MPTGRQSLACHVVAPTTVVDLPPLPPARDKTDARIVRNAVAGEANHRTVATEVGDQVDRTAYTDLRDFRRVLLDGRDIDGCRDAKVFAKRCRTTKTARADAKFSPSANRRSLRHFVP